MQVFDRLEIDLNERALLLPKRLPGPCHAVVEYAVSPHEPWLLRWNVLVLGVVVYSCIQVPYAAAVTPLAEATIISRLVDLIFYLDMALSFFTGYDVGYEIVMIKRRIVFNYLSGWFIIDLAATVDWELALSLFFEDDKTLPGWVRMLKILKILRLARAGRLIDNLSANWSTQSGFVDAGKFFVYVSMIAHLLACFFFMWPMLINENTWFVGSPECAKDEAAAAAARSCIENGGVDADGAECDMFSAVGWYYNGTCMQYSWREQQGLEQIRLPQVCGRKASGDWDWAFETDGGRWDFLTKCAGGTPARSLTADEATETLLMCMDTAELDLHPSDENYQICPKCARPLRLYLLRPYIWNIYM